MATYGYRAIDRKGQGQRGELVARDQADALAQVRRLGMTPLAINEARASTAAPKAAGGHKSRKEVSKALGELGVLINAGLPVDRAVSLCLDNIEHRAVQAEFRRLLAAVRHGEPLSQAMAAQPGLFPANARAMIEAGEANGRLGDALARVERMFEQAEEIRRLVVGAMTYPLILLLLAISVILMMLLFVVPQFESLFASVHGELPASSRALMAASKLLRQHGLALGFGLIVVVVAVRQLLSRPEIARTRDKLLLGLPQFGKLIRMLEASRLARTLSALIEGGVALPDALAMSSRAVGNRIVAEAISGVAGEVKEGGAVTSRIAATGVLPSIALGFFRTGEETSQLGPMLGRLADVLERDVTIRIQSLVAILTPVITIVLGGSVAAIIASIMSAILGFNDVAVNQ